MQIRVLRRSALREKVRSQVKRRFKLTSLKYLLQKVTIVEFRWFIHCTCFWWQTVKYLTTVTKTNLVKFDEQSLSCMKYIWLNFANYKSFIHTDSVIHISISLEETRESFLNCLFASVILANFWTVCIESWFEHYCCARIKNLSKFEDFVCTAGYNKKPVHLPHFIYSEISRYLIRIWW